VQHFDINPPHVTQPCAERFANRFLGSNPRRQSERHILAVLALGIGEKAFIKPLPVPRGRPCDTFDLNHIHPNPQIHEANGLLLGSIREFLQLE
jgi:hypothetical protein